MGWNHTSDAVLEGVFRRHEGEFEALLAEVQADVRLTTLQRKVLIYAGRVVDVTDNDLSGVDRAGLPRERWLRYQHQLVALGLYGVMKGDGRVEFRVDSGSILNGDSYKGFVYCVTPPSPVLGSLDGYRASGNGGQVGDQAVYKRVDGNWYLSLFVNR